MLIKPKLFVFLGIFLHYIKIQIAKTSIIGQVVIIGIVGGGVILQHQQNAIGFKGLNKILQNFHVTRIHTKDQKIKIPKKK